jgi:hypothetical protein
METGAKIVRTESTTETHPLDPVNLSDADMANATISRDGIIIIPKKDHKQELLRIPLYVERDATQEEAMQALQRSIARATAGFPIPSPRVQEQYAPLSLKQSVLRDAGIDPTISFKQRILQIVGVPPPKNLQQRVLVDAGINPDALRKKILVEGEMPDELYPLVIPVNETAVQRSKIERNYLWQRLAGLRRGYEKDAIPAEPHLSFDQMQEREAAIIKTPNKVLRDQEIERTTTVKAMSALTEIANETQAPTAAAPTSV